MRIGQRALAEARNLGGQALLLGSYKTLGLRVAAAIALHIVAASAAIVVMLYLLSAASCEHGCFRPGPDFCCLGNLVVVLIWSVLLLVTACSSWISTRLITRREFGMSAAVTALIVVTALIYFGVVGYAISELAILAGALFCASYLGFRLAY